MLSHDALSTQALAMNRRGCFFPMELCRKYLQQACCWGGRNEAEWETETVETVDGSRLFMLSDGAAESFNDRGECFGRLRLAELCAQSRKLSIRDSLAWFYETLTTFRNGASQGDDVTILLVEFNVNE